MITREKERGGGNEDMAEIERERRKKIRFSRNGRGSRKKKNVYKPYNDDIYLCYILKVLAIHKNGVVLFKLGQHY